MPRLLSHEGALYQKSWPNPSEITSRLWPMKMARPFVVLDVVLGTVLGLLLLLDAANERLTTIPHYTELESWKFFGWAVLANIVVVVCLSVGLVFVASISKPIQSMPKRERDSKRTSRKIVDAVLDAWPFILLMWILTMLK